MESYVMPVDTFFGCCQPPKGLVETEAKLEKFKLLQMSRNRKVVCVTSGGTTVPLEMNTVRFLDNFSAGTRGAASTEKFLEAGYAVVFLHRQYSLHPYSRNYSESSACLFDYMSENSEGNVEIKYPYEHEEILKERLRFHKKFVNDDNFLSIDFVTVFDYLFLLKSCATILSDMKRDLMFYLAAAVSDFFISPQNMATHKIQSSDGPLKIQTEHVPKMLKTLRHQWAPEAYVVSFKLETDTAMIVPKSKQAIEKYGVHLVIANLLQTRKNEVTFVTSDSSYTIVKPEYIQDIEHLMISRLTSIHQDYINMVTAGSNTNNSSNKH